MLYRPDPSFGVAVPVEMREDCTEADGRRTTATATYSLLQSADEVEDFAFVGSGLPPQTLDGRGVERDHAAEAADRQ